MASTSETGHAKNVANFEDIISFCTGYGTAYNPSKYNLQIDQLQTLHTSAKETLQTLKTTKTTFDNNCNAREIAFAPLKKLCTRIVNALAATDATKQTVDDAKNINRKIQGRRADTSKTTTPEGRQISVSQQSFDSLIDNFAKLIVSVTAESLYTPNETDLQVPSLNTTLAGLESLNTAVKNATTPYNNAIIARNTTLYLTNTGLVDIALDVKKYVKSVFGATSPQYKQISGLEFKKVK